MSLNTKEIRELSKVPDRECVVKMLDQLRDEIIVVACYQNVIYVDISKIEVGAKW